MDEPLTPVAVLVVDDHPVVRSGLAGIVSGDQRLRLIGEAGSGAEAIQLVQERRPDVVLMDLAMPAMNGVEALTAIRAIEPRIHIVILTAFDDQEGIYQGLRAGARAYLLKDSPREEIVACILKVSAGGLYLPAGVASKLADRTAESVLSAREIEIIRLLATGKTNKEIARVASITEGTVKFHVNAILSKLGASTRTEAVTIAVKRGLINLG